MNILKRKIIAIKMIKDIAKGKSMNNYKFDEKVSSEVSSAFEANLENEKFYVLESKINKVFEDLKMSSSENIPHQNFIGKYIKINNVFAIDSDMVDEYNFLDKQFADKVEAIQFEINSLNKHKQKCLTDFNIARAVKLNDKINLLNVKLAEVYSEINKYNNEIADKEQDFVCAYEKISSHSDNGFDFDNLSEEFDEGVVLSYKRNVLIKKLTELFNGLELDELKQVLNNSKIKQAVGSYYNNLIENIKYVGTDN